MESKGPSKVAEGLRRVRGAVWPRRKVGERHSAGSEDGERRPWTQEYDQQMEKGDHEPKSMTSSLWRLIPLQSLQKAPSSAHTLALAQWALPAQPCLVSGTNDLIGLKEVVYHRHCSVVPSAVTTRLLCPRDSPSKNTGVGSHSLLQGIFPTRDQTRVFYVSCIGRRGLYH